MQIVDLTDNERLTNPVAELLKDGFSDTGTGAWSTLDESLETVRESSDDNNISRVAIDPDGKVLGWAYGAPLYDNFTWELEVLVVDRRNQRKGVGTKLLGDFESEVLKRDGLNVFLGSDDENARTSIGGIELYPNPLEHVRNIKNLRGHPYEFYQKQGYVITGVLPDANGTGKPDIYMCKRLG